MEILFEFIAEVIIQLVLEILSELGVRSIRETTRRPPNPFLAAFGYAVLGAMAGGISLLMHAEHFTKSMEMRIAVVGLVPFAVGACMAWLGSWRSKRGQDLIRLDKFAYGYLFALSLALVRYFFAQ